MAPSAHGIDAVRAWLDERAVSYEVIEHGATFSAVEESEATGVPSGFTAKTLVLHDRAGYLLAVIPASRRLDEHRMRELLGATAHLRLATEEEIGREFPGFDTGAAPVRPAPAGARGRRRPPALPRPDRLRRGRPPPFALARPPRAGPGGGAPGGGRLRARGTPPRRGLRRAERALGLRGRNDEHRPVRDVKQPLGHASQEQPGDQ
jgi:Aminoacyl-tRNA editing domain